MKTKTYKLPIETIDAIAALSAQTGLSQGKIIAAAIENYREQLPKNR